MSKILFNPRQPDLQAIRRMMFERLRTDLRWNSFNSRGNDYSGYVEFEGRSQEQLAFYVLLGRRSQTLTQQLWHIWQRA